MRGQVGGKVFTSCMVAHMDFEEIKSWILPIDYNHAEAEAKHLIYKSDKNKVSCGMRGRVGGKVFTSCKVAHMDFEEFKSWILTTMPRQKLNIS